VHGQPDGDAQALLDRGLALSRAGAPTDAAQVLERAVEQARAERTPRVEGHALRALASLRADAKDVAGAEALWARAAATFSAVEDWRAVGAVHTAHALAAFGSGDDAGAERGWLAALAAFEAAGDPLELSRGLRNLSFVRRLALEERIALVRRAAEYAHLAGDTRQIGLVEHQLSDLLYLDGDVAAAVEHLQAALSRLEPQADQTSLARALTSYGRLHRVLGRPDASIALNRRAAALLEASGDFSGAAQALDAITRALIDTGDPGLIESAGAALDMARRGRSLPMLTLALCRMATVLSYAGRPAEARAYVEEAADLRSAGVATCVNEALAAVESAAGNPEAVLAAHDASDMSAASVEDRIAHSWRRARVLTRLDRSAEASAELRRAVAMLDDVAARLVPVDGAKRGYFERMRALVDLHVAVLIDLGEFEDALEASERGRARAFLDLLTARALDEPSGDRPVPAEMTGPAPRPADVLAGPPRPLTLEGLLQRSRPPASGSSSPEPIVASPAAAVVPSLATVRATAARLGSHVLIYWVAAERTAIWVVAPDGAVTGAQQPVGRTELTALVRSAAGLGQSGGAATRGGTQVAFDPASRRALRRLRAALLDPVQGALPRDDGARLTVIPDGPLFALSFAGLPGSSGRYLIEDYELHYAPSVGALAALPSRAGTRGPVLVVADPATTALDASGTPLARLPAAAAEGRAIQRVLAGHAVDVLSDRAASESRVRAALADAAVIHFATHGVVSDTAPWTSFLALGGAGSRLDDDGRLTAGELYDLGLKAQLAVLGACRSAVGPPTGDGITGLARGFFAAGVPSVVASLWDLPDATTAVMQPAFYRRWQATQSPASALRHAQLDLLARLRSGKVTVATPLGPLTVPEHPAVWAGLIAIGLP
jgi:CHAT domain-containing protein/tetratricopeptide (TPR) repeat protein